MDPPHSYILEEGICYLALCDPTYPAKLAFNYLENLHKDFSEQHGNDVHKASRPYHFIEFGTYLYLPSIFCRLNYKVMLFSCVSIGHAQLGNTSTCSFLCVYCFNSVLLPLLYIPYSAKFSRHLYFVDWPLKAISLHNVRGMTAYRKPRL